jgi:hypothetical protein
MVWLFCIQIDAYFQLMKQKLLFGFSLGLLIVLEVLRVYFIMPFPGSQQSNTLEIAYWIGNNIVWLRVLLVVCASYFLFKSFSSTKLFQKIIYAVLIIFYVVVFYLFNFRFLADKMFYQPKVVQFSNASESKISKEKLVLGVVLNGEAKAYPIQIIGYHHQVQDEIGGTSVLVTYCTVCRTGRVYEPNVNGKPETFRLVGMDHFNAMFEDASTKSWWRQVSGEAVTGPLKGSKLVEIPSRQMSLASWLQLYPASKILQPDSNFSKQYAALDGYDNGSLSSFLEKRDTISWQPKSFVVGIVYKNASKAYDWNNLERSVIIQDSLPGLPLLLTLENKTSFHSFNRELNGVVYNFQLDADKRNMIDTNTGSTWNLQGACTSGPLNGSYLRPIQSYQEFWHSWQTFHPGTMR